MRTCIGRAGEERNAGYWYRRAGKPHARTPLNEEWDEIVAALLSKRTGEPVSGDEAGERVLVTGATHSPEGARNSARQEPVYAARRSRTTPCARRPPAAGIRERASP